MKTGKKSFYFYFSKILFFVIPSVLLIGGILIFLGWQTGFVADAVKSYLNKNLKGYAHIEYRELYGSPFNSIKIKNFSVVLNSGTEFKVNYLELRYRLLPLLKNKIVFDRIIVDRLQIQISAEGEEARKETAPFNADTLLASWQDYFFPAEFLSGLPSVDVKDVEIVSSEVRFKDQPVTLVNVSMDISRLRLRRNYVFLMLTDLSGLWREKNLELKSLSMVLKGDENGININQGELKTAKSKIIFNALLNPKTGLNLNLTEFFLNFDEIAEFSGVDSLKGGNLAGSVAVSGMPVRFGAEGELKGEWRGRKLRSLKFLVNYDRGQVYLKNLIIDANFARLKARAYWNQEKRITGDLSFKNIDLAVLYPDFPPTQLNGSLHLNASHLSLKNLTGAGTLKFFNSSIDTFKIDSVQLAINANKGFFHFKKPSFIKIADSSKFFFEGTLDRGRNIDIDLLTFDNSLPVLFRDLGLRKIKGKLDARIHLFGPLVNPNFSGTLFIPKLDFTTIRLDTVKFNLFVEGIAHKRLGSGQFNISSGKIGEFPLDRVSFELKTRRNTVELKDLKFISGKNFFNTDVIGWWSYDSVNVKAYPFKIQYKDYWISGKDTLTATLTPQMAILENFTFIGPQASEVTINGFYDFEMKDFQTYISLNQLQIAPFEQFYKSNINLRGKVNGFIEILTPLTDPNMEIDLKVDSLSVQNVLLGNITSQISFANESFVIERFSLTNGKSELKAEGGLSLRMKGKKFDILSDTRADLRLFWKRLQLKQFAPLVKGLRRVKGVSSGEITIEGIVNAPRIHTAIRLDDFQIEDLKGDSLNIFGQYNDGYILLDSLSVVLDGSHIQARGWQKYKLSLTEFNENILQEPFQLNIRSRDNRLLFLGYLNEQVESVQGPYQIDLTLGGTPQKPSIQEGFIKLENGEVLLSMIRDPIRNVNFDGEIKDSILKIKKFSARSL
ncbi:MAG: hypothetical protein GXO77_16025, partial [Calditrichaeota bacterium]|nr:hypothetical protein [Calditrichota bacterium]